MKPASPVTSRNRPPSLRKTWSGTGWSRNGTQYDTGPPEALPQIRGFCGSQAT